MINPISGPTFSASLPFCWQAQDGGVHDCGSDEWEVIRYLLVLADFEQNSESIELAQARQDLLLLWLARSQTMQLPATQALTVGLSRLAWHARTAPRLGEQGLIRLAFSTRFPLVLGIEAKICAIQPDEQGVLCIAELIFNSPQLQDQFEQTVFRYHRRAIQLAKQTQP